MCFLFGFLDTNLFHTPVFESDSFQPIFNSEIDVASNIKDINQPVFVGETRRVVETQESQQLTAVEEHAPVNKNKMVVEAKSQAGNGNELNASDAGYTASGSAEQTSNHVIVVTSKIEEIKHVMVQETAVIDTLTESMQKSPGSPEKTTVGDQNNIGKGNEVGETGSTDVDSTVQVPIKDLIPNNNPNFENVSRRSSNELSDISHGNDGCAGKLTNNSDPGTEEDKPSLQELNEVVGKSNELVEETRTTGTRNVDHDQRTPELVQQSEEKNESDMKGGDDKPKTESEKPRNNSGISDANGEGDKVEEMVGENVITTTGNDQQIAKETGKNSKDDESSRTRRATGSTTDAKDETSKLQQLGDVQKYTVYRKPELEKESGRKNKKKGKTNT
ncbi:Hypothetical predicted protein [Paramuricea clavata]|uniref:Uncharacterized protein n=1 Tax=Paramuricea clavata TaxID=317549 RepID=A0A7D9LLN4_PARCT|nr:Hypothetical predicted protein [Paramuricea clavata]